MRKKDFKLYADECIEQYYVYHLREKHNLDVKSVIDEGLQGKADEIILKRANEQRRFLLTYNTRDFFHNYTLYPFNGLFGIISLKFHKTNCLYNNLEWLLKHDKQSLRGKKFLVSHDNIRVKYKSEEGKLVTERIDLEECLLCYPDESAGNSK